MEAKRGDKVRLLSHSKTEWRLDYMNTYEDVMEVLSVYRNEVRVRSSTGRGIYESMVISHGNYSIVSNIVIGGE